MPNNDIRIVGSNYTFLTWTAPQSAGGDAGPSENFSRASGAIAYMQTINDSGQQAFQNVTHETVYEIGFSHPVDFVVQETTAPGRLEMSLLDVWDEPAWARLSKAFAGAVNISDINRAQLGFTTLPQVHIIIAPPPGKSNGELRGKTCHDVLITSIPSGESVAVGQMSRNKTISAVYRYATPLNAAGSATLTRDQQENLFNNTFGRGI